MDYGFAEEKEPKRKFRTQKALGIKVLANHGFNTPTFDVFGVEDFTKPMDFYKLVNKFVRPCPMVPRHGFVDSRPITSLEEAETIVNETRRVESDAEFVAMPFIQAEYSAIWTPNKLIIGTGNDGATSGKNSRVIPCLGLPIKSKYVDWNILMNSANVKDSPYIELLWEKKKSYTTDPWKNFFVQLRNGPKLPESIDFIPSEIEVKQVVVAEGDLLEWETKAKQFEAGTVVYHPNGSLGSHYAVHCVLNNIPVIVSHEPKVGEILRQLNETKEVDIELLRTGFVMGCTRPLSYQQAGYAMLVGCHNTAVWMGNQDVLLGFALGTAYRLILTASLGEFRHQPGRKRKASRNALYARVWDKVLTNATRTRYLKCLESFEKDNWTSSFGGKKWLIFARYAGEILNNLLDKDVKKALENFNQAVHAAHNGGWAFNKFLTDDVLDVTAENPIFTMLKCAPELYCVVIESEKDRSAAEWFKGRRHYEFDELDLDGAKKDEESEDRNGELGCTCEMCKPVVKKIVRSGYDYQQYRNVVMQVKYHPENEKDKQLEIQYKLKTGDVEYFVKYIPFPDARNVLKLTYTNIPVGTNKFSWNNLDSGYIWASYDPSYTYNHNMWFIEGDPGYYFTFDIPELKIKPQLKPNVVYARLENIDGTDTLTFHKNGQLVASVPASKKWRHAYQNAFKNDEYFEVKYSPISRGIGKVWEFAVHTNHSGNFWFNCPGLLAIMQGT